MAREFPLWICVLLPWLAALPAVLGGRPLVALLGPRRAGLLAQYLALGASALLVLFCMQGVEALLVPDDPRGLAHTPWPDRLPPLTIGELRLELVLVGDRLSMSATLLIGLAMVVARIFMGGPAGLRDLGLGPEYGPQAWLRGEDEDAGADAKDGAGDREDEGEAEAVLTALRRLGLLGLLEGAAVLVVLAGDLGLAVIGWATLGVAAAVAVARSLRDEVRASAATRVLAVAMVGDLCLGAAAVVLVLAGIGLAHTGLWAPLVGDRLYAIGLLGLPTAELTAALLLVAAFSRLVCLTWAGNSMAEALLEAVLIPTPAIYLLLRFHRVLAFAPTTLAVVLVLGCVLTLSGATAALLRPEGGQGRRGARPGIEQGLSGTALCWAGLIAMAVGVGSWRTVALLLLAHALGRLGLRAALLLTVHDEPGGDGHGGLPRWTGRGVRLLVWMVAGVAPGLGFVAIAWTLVDVLTRKSLLGPSFGWFAAAVVLLAAFVHAAAIGRVWYEGLRGELTAEAAEDGLDVGPLLLILAASLGLGVLALISRFAAVPAPLVWLDPLLPLAGGHEGAPLGLRDGFRDGIEVARPWIAGGAALVALVTGFAWTWARDRFRRADGGELSTLARGLEATFAGPRTLHRWLLLSLAGLTELAARGVARGLFEEGPRVFRRLIDDGLRMRPSGGRWGGGRLAIVGLLSGVLLLLSWLYAKPEVASMLPSDGYGFGGLRPKLIRAGGARAGEDGGAATAPAAETPSEVNEAGEAQPIPLAPDRTVELPPEVPR